MTWSSRRATPLLIALLASGACAKAPDNRTGPPLVVVTIYPVADLVSRVGGDAIRVRTLLPPRASVHTWEATPGQIREVNHAAGYVSVGGGLDTWLDHAAADLPGLRKLRVTDGIDLSGSGHGEAEGTGDPHVWLDPILVRDSILPRLTSFLIDIVPGDAVGVRARSRALYDSLTVLDRDIRRTLAGAGRRSFIATHDAWSYFAHRYGLRPLGSLYESPGHEPSARALAALVDAARAAGVGAVLSEPQLAETAAGALAGELDVSVVIVDPLGGPGIEGREGYMQLMRFDARAFARALEDS